MSLVDAQQVDIQSIDLKISKWGNSNAIRLPSNLLKALGMAENDEFTCRINKSNQLILEMKKKEKNEFKPKSVAELFKDYDSDYKGESEVDWGEPVGNEVW